MNATADTTTVAPSPEDKPVEAVDAALAEIGARLLFTADEARRLLDEVVRGAAGGPHAGQIEPLVSAAAEAIGDPLLVDRACLADAMLDIRLALQH